MPGTNFGRKKSTAYATLLGTGTDTDPEDVKTLTNKNFLDFRLKTSAASGDTRGLYMRLHFNGAGGGEAIRAFAQVDAAGVAAGDTVNGIHATLDIEAAAGSVSGAGNAIRATLEASANSRTLGGTCAALQLDSSVGSGNTVPASWSLIRVTKSDSVSVGTFINFADTQVLKGNSTIGSLADGIKCLVNGTVGYIPIYE